MGNQDQPLVTFLVPCYKSASFMSRGIDSILAATEATGFPCEIILINDGSPDETGDIARRYAEEYPQIIAIDQKNTNWGGVVNRGIRIASGLYFKVLDSDDYFDELALLHVLAAIARAAANGNTPDLIITNYVYDHLSSDSQRVMQYRSFFPADRVFTWDEMGRPGQDKFIMIHAAWYKTSILHESGVELPTGISYTDSLLLLHPMPFVKTLLYLNVEPYHYIIGREGQSVEVDVVKKHIDEQLLATRLAISDVDYAELYEKQPNCAMLMTGYISCMMSVSTIHLFMIDTPESIEKNRQIWAYLKHTNPALYENVKKSWAGRANRKTRLGRLLARGGYAIGQHIYKFG